MDAEEYPQNMAWCIMSNLIDDIIELILDNVDCQHDQTHEEDGVHHTVEYSLDREAIVKIKIREMIEEGGKNE